MLVCQASQLVLLHEKFKRARSSDDKCLTHFGASLRNNKSSNHLEANNILHNRKGMPADWKTPEFTEGFQALRLQQGNDAMFKAKVDGDPRPEVTWTKNKKVFLKLPKYTEPSH